MHYHILPQNFESPMPMLTVIGYSSGRLIAISEEGKLFYMTQLSKRSGDITLSNSSLEH